jgi:hypothetical protein
MAFAVISASAVFAAVPSIGGTPTLTDTDDFVSPALDWKVTVYSYAFLGTGGADPVPVGLPDPAEGQTLFAYVPDSDDLAISAVDQFQVGDPFGLAITVAGFSPTILPSPGFLEEDRQNPSGVQVSIPAFSVTYLYNGSSSFDSGEFSVLYFLSAGVPDQVPATVRGGASLTDLDLVLGPVPEPGTIGGLLIGGMIYGLFGTRTSRLRRLGIAG